MTRIVPVRLIAGKRYVLICGDEVTVRETDHWQARKLYPFMTDYEGEPLYFREDGRSNLDASKDEANIARPVYCAGERYTVNGLDSGALYDNDHSIYPLRSGKGSTYTEDGRYVVGQDNPNLDFMDYAPAVECASAAPVVEYVPAVPEPKDTGPDVFVPPHQSAVTGLGLLLKEHLAMDHIPLAVVDDPTAKPRLSAEDRAAIWKAYTEFENNNLRKLVEEYRFLFYGDL